MEIIPFWVVYVCFALAFGITMTIRVVPKINRLLKRPSIWKVWNHILFFIISTVGMPIVSLAVLNNTEKFIAGYVGAMNED